MDGTGSDNLKKIRLPSCRELKASAKKLGLRRVDTLDKVSDETMEEEFNGVGPDSWPALLRDILSYVLEDVLEAVLVHDMDYVVGGDEAEFHDSNKALEDNVRLIAKKKYHFWNARRYFLRELAPKLREWTDDYGWPGWNKTGA